MPGRIDVFARHGYDGGRIEQVSKAANSHDRMIYYWSGDWEDFVVKAVLAVATCTTP